MPGLYTMILAVAALHLARPTLAPVAFSLFIIAIVWPFQWALQSRVPELMALADTLEGHNTHLARTSCAPALSVRLLPALVRG
jgi:hypothetical protein